MPNVEVYGIPTCNSVKTAMRWFTRRGVEVLFHNFHKEPPTRELVAEWIEKAGVNTVINKRSRTWMLMSSLERSQVEATLDGLLDACVAHPTIIKRPVVVNRVKGTLVFGVDDRGWAHSC